MSDQNSLVQELVDHANDTYKQIAAVFYDAKMRTVSGGGMRFMYVAAPPGLGSSPKETLAAVRPLIAARNPEWLEEPKGPMLIDKDLRDARMKRSPLKELLSEDPAKVTKAYRERVIRAARAIARVTGQLELAKALEGAGPEVDAVAGSLLSRDNVNEALLQEQVQTDLRTRQAAEERLATGRQFDAPNNAPDLGFGQGLNGPGGQSI